VMGSGGLMNLEPAEWDRMMDTNLRAMFLLTKAAAPELIKKKGAVVNISSVAGPRPYANLMGYVVSKAGVDAFTRCAALDLAPHGVRVNALNPGVVVSELQTVGGAVPDYPAFLERSKATHPLGRVGQPEEIAALVLWLLSAESSWITGANVPIDGGRQLLSAR
jgi:NAD(P)-dependent dehydrogenase (short-subunit alcohol dehydrogenase family)